MATDFNETRYSASEFTLDSAIEMARIHKAIGLLKKSRPEKILDVGCTDGLVSRLIKQMTGGYVIGIDASHAAIEKAQKICDETHVMQLGDTPIPLESASVDAVYAGEIIEHVFNTEFFLEELYRVAKPGARMVLSTPNLGAWFNRVLLLSGLQPLFTDTGVKFSNSGNWLTKPSLPAGHIRNFTLSSLSHLLHSCHWKIEEVHGQSILGNRLRPLDRLISQSFPSLASDMIVVCRK